MQARIETAEGLEYLCQPRPFQDLQLELQERDDYDPYEGLDDKTANSWQREARKYCGKPASQFPEWPWIFSRAADHMHSQQQLEAQKRDQDLFGMHIYNDWTGYGLQEVVENQAGHVSAAWWKMLTLIPRLACKIPRNLQKG
jgi:hypothetical protein